MRTRTIVATVSGALALSALAVPAAQADEVQGDTTISNVVVNGGKPVVVGAGTTKRITVSFTVRDDSGVDRAMGVLWHGTDFDHLDSGATANTSDGYSVCTAVSATTSTCKATYDFKPGYNAINAVAGTWKTWAIAAGKDYDYVQKDNVKAFYVKRATALTVNASPEPVRKGKTITVTGKLTRANWNYGNYGAFGSQYVKLQYKKKGATSYTTLKTIKSSSTGALSTTTTATYDGYYRFVYAGISSSAAVNSTADFVDVQ
ncbi:calcium-binding protein [Streptomyces sp. enrichment culture]|uniref:calcium-binding protein n=1 Tax=Streptomyces sp. enrichment culture TaxID=1795815 RepID=UPI003F5624BF